MKKGHLLQADYTRKTQELAQQRQAVEARAAQLETNERQMSDYLKALFNDPQVLRDELELRAPVAFQRAVVAMANEMAKEADLPEDIRAERNRLREEKRQLRIDKMRTDREKQERDTEMSKTRREQLTRSYAVWVPAALKDAGLLDDTDGAHNRDMLAHVKGRLLQEYGNTDWSEEQIRAAAKSVAESPSIKMYLAQRGSLVTDPEQFEKIFGPEAMAKLRKHEADKVKRAKSPAKPAGKPSKPSRPVTPGKPKQGTPGKTFEQIRDEVGL